MKRRDWLYWLLLAIALTTVLSGLVQIISPGLVLGVMGAETTPTDRHFFGIIGMFMALFGGALTHALLSPSHHRIVVLWAGLQKVGAVIAVGCGVQRGILSRLALAVAAFDLASAILVLLYWVRLRKESP